MAAFILNKKVPRTRAAILTKQHSPLIFSEVEIPALGPGQVLVNVKATSICGKQIDEITGKQGKDPYIPHLLGHEGSGVVLDAGKGVRKVKPGDHVILHWIKGSGFDAKPANFRWRGKKLNAGCCTTFSEYTVVSENRLTKISKNIPFNVAPLLGCAVTTGLGIVLNDAKMKKGESIVIFGVGGVGINVIQAAKLIRAKLIVAVDLHSSKLNYAKKFGATKLIKSDAKVKQRLLKSIGDKGFDVAVDTTGNAKVRELAYEVTSNKGRTILAGVPHHGEKITIDSFPLHFGRRIFGSHGGGTKPDRDIPFYLNLYSKGKIKLREQISCFLPLSKINQALTLMKVGKISGRCMILMNGNET